MEVPVEKIISLVVFLFFNQYFVTVLSGLFFYAHFHIPHKNQ